MAITDDLVKSIDYIENRFPKGSTLLITVLASILLFAFLDNFISKIIPFIYYRLILYLCILLILVLVWLYYKYRLPSNNNRVGMIIAINTENDKQKIRVKNDFISRLNELIAENNLKSQLNVILLNNFQSEKVSKILNDYTFKQNEINKTFGEQELLKIKTPKEFKKWGKLQNKTRGHFYIWGSIKERLDTDQKYFFKLDALVIHNPVNKVIHEKLQKDFLTIWFKNISFIEKLELKGFQLTADLVFIAAKYIIGIAALISGDLFLANKLHETLENDFKKFTPIPPNILKIQGQLRPLLAEEYFLIGRSYYLPRGDFNKSSQYLDKSIKINPKNYGGYIGKSLIEFVHEKNPQKALNSVLQAKWYAGEDGTWRYNLGFLLLYTEKFKEALKIYEDIKNNCYPGEESVVEEVINFNENILKCEKNKIQSYFIIGFIQYFKKENYPLAFSNFEKFIQYSNLLPKFSELEEQAKKYYGELKKKMGL